eukprot:COSAG01_NODE_34042_length_554_cov_1.850549_1_plen_105_part_01
MRRERPLEAKKHQTASQPLHLHTCTRRCDMSWKELLNLGAGGVGGRRGGRRREDQGWKVIPAIHTVQNPFAITPQYVRQQRLVRVSPESEVILKYSQRPRLTILG